ncbi:MAG: YbhB/YbcL family Raf kinase inhibitor-like protein [Chloroflexi bacterium]|nr:YbhB/YbcL family Raf kinase inhibitor-like protein [Chloroflexota bacterium]
MKTLCALYAVLFAFVLVACAAPTPTPVPPTATPPPTATSVPPTSTPARTATPTRVPPTNTSVPPAATSVPPTNTRAPFALTVTAFAKGAAIPLKYVCNDPGFGGQNISPELKWNEPPSGTKGFVLLMYDPDIPGAPPGYLGAHWVLYNLPAALRALPEGYTKGRLPQGATELLGYFGPCPPRGNPHRYFLRLFAVKDTVTPPTREQLNANQGNVQFILNALKDQTLAETEYMGTYGR